MKTSIRKNNTLIYIVLFAASIIFLFPFYWMIRSSLMDIRTLFGVPPQWIPSHPKFGNYIEAFTALPFSKFYINTIIVAGTAVLGVILTSTISAYSFARLRWPGRELTFSIILSSLMLPTFATLIPTFIGWKYLGLVNTYVPLVAASWFGGGAFNIFLLRQFYLSIPKELDEAAIVDGAGYFRIFTRIIFPLSKPATIVVALFCFLYHWNDFINPMVYLNDTNKYTLAIGLSLFQSTYTAQWNLSMAAAALVCVPAIALFVLGQKYFVEGIAMTGLKG